MTKTKLIAQKIAWLPDAFWPVISDRALEVGLAHVNSCIAISYDNRYVTDERGRPLLFIWAHRQSLLSLNLELCMIATKNLKAKHVRAAKELVWDWIKEQRHPIYARCDAPSTRRFLEFMGFTEVEEEGGNARYKAVING